MRVVLLLLLLVIVTRVVALVVLVDDEQELSESVMEKCRPSASAARFQMPRC